MAFVLENQISVDVEKRVRPPGPPENTVMKMYTGKHPAKAHL